MRGKAADLLIEAGRAASDLLDYIHFSAPVSHVYNPLVYASVPYETYISRFAGGRKKVLLLGMNPGPWGMAQTGVPFGEIEAVRDWMGIRGEVGKPPSEHPKRRIEGFSCTRSEVSGRRLWGLMKERFGTARSFFADHFVANYCPLIFLESTGRNRTPDKLSAAERGKVFGICDELLAKTIELLQPEWLVGVGKFAEKMLLASPASENRRTIAILHPSPANPHANRGWSERATAQLTESGVWVE